MSPQSPNSRASTVKKSFDIYGHFTSVSLETEFWDALREIAETEDVSIRSIVLRVDEERLGRGTAVSGADSNLNTNTPPPNLSSRLRVYILNYYRGKIR